jgi:hypothetical protein
VAEDFYSFEKVLRELHLQEEELKKLVSEGEIRAFRDDDKMKFKKEDIERFKKQAPANLPTIEAPSGELTDELFGDDDGGRDDVGMVTQQIDDSSFLEEDVGAIEPLELESASERGGKRRGAARPAAAAGARAARRRPDEEPATEGVGMQVLLVLGGVVLLYALIVGLNAAQVQQTGLSKGFASFIANNFMK